MVELINLEKTFNKGSLDERKALNGLSLKLNEGDFLTIIGGNGAGKSTLFNAICGNFFLDEGKIIINNEDFTFKRNYERANSIGYLFQDPRKGTAPNMTILENLLLAYKRNRKNENFFGASKKEKAFFREQLEQLNLNLEDRLESKVGLLSGGQRQALSLLMTTIAKPKLLLLDEHTAALDPETSDKIESLTTKIVARDNITCMMITHNISQALAQGNKLIMINKGNIVINLGEEKKELEISNVLDLFKDSTKTNFDNDRILLN